MKNHLRFLYILICLTLFLLPGCGGSAESEKNQLEKSKTEEDEEQSNEIDSADSNSGKTNPADIDSDKTDSTDVYSDKTDSSAEGTSGISTPSGSGALQVSGTQLVDNAGNPVQLRGISTHGLAWFPDYVNEACFSEFRQDWNVNVMRLAMYTAENGGYCTGGDQNALKQLVCNGIDYAARQDMYVIVDWHILSDNNPKTYQEEAKTFFAEISGKYADSDHILYEICNEPNGGTSWSDIKSYAEAVIPVIRANDPDAVIIVGTPNWSQFVDQAAADPITDYDNIMYTLHFYAATHKDDLRSKMASAVSAGLPIFVTEYGICDASGNGALDIDQANLWVEEMNKYGISYVAWNLSNKSESSAILKSSCAKTSGFTQEDLSEAGRWLYQMLTGQSGSAGPSSAQQSTSTNSALQQNDSGAQQGNADNAASQQNTKPGAASASRGDLSLSLSLKNNWETNGVPYYQYDLTITNNGADCSQWSVDLGASPGTAISDSWNGIYSLNGTTLHISNADYNGNIPSGGSIGDVGFIVYGGQIQP